MSEVTETSVNAAPEVEATTESFSAPADSPRTMTFSVDSSSPVRNDVAESMRENSLERSMLLDTRPSKIPTTSRLLAPASGSVTACRDFRCVVRGSYGPTGT